MDTNNDDFLLNQLKEELLNLYGISKIIGQDQWLDEVTNKKFNTLDEAWDFLCKSLNELADQSRLL